MRGRRPRMILSTQLALLAASWKTGRDVDIVEYRLLMPASCLRIRRVPANTEAEIASVHKVSTMTMSNEQIRASLSM